MKTMKLKTKVVFALMAFGLLITGCTENESTEPVTEDQELTEVVQSSEMDVMSASLEDFIIEVYEDQENAEAKGMVSSKASFPNCVTVTLVMEENFRELTVDFADGGCVIRGHLYEGQVVITYERNPIEHQVFLGYVLNDFYFDNKHVIGSNSILRELSNDNGNPQFTHTVDLTVVWPSGMQASREGQIIREWIEGFDSGVFTDNVFEITGYWNATFVNGGTHSYEIVLPLRREVTCYHFVAGSIDVERTFFGGILDYGDGACDNLATFTFTDGTVIDIILN
ncbi:hypothetical protein [Xanthomarina spongicola]|uniref:Lipoprotein n=1 Tax=Xanthomarina spongicola TaxID=570520 RepID=A0A316DLX7_9FLAO|nr:hypothetical protein [Xanthomarina spongicola]PWK19144.1 hypothetical protein LX78_01624 [Xanthomarina spongicola]